jgi:hypothetical protein
MVKRIMMDEFHVTVFVPAALPTAAYRAIRRTLDEGRLCVRLQAAVKGVFGKYPSLARAVVRLSR